MRRFEFYIDQDFAARLIDNVVSLAMRSDI
jgi:hypothetical protein